MLSWILKKKIQIIFLIGLLCICIINITIAVALLIISIIGYVSNKMLMRKIKLINKDVLDFMHDARRNFDKLIIGDGRYVPGNDSPKSLTFVDSGRTLLASYLYLIHFYSYLRDDGEGKVYVYASLKNKDNMSVSIYDIFAFHRVIRMRLNATSPIIDSFPIFFLLKKFRNKHYFIDSNNLSIEDRIIEFCKLRNIKVELIKR